MPRPNQARSIASETALARRIAHERQVRGWSYDGLASRVSAAGCAIASSAIYKIEKADPPRRITVDELVAFAQVFEVPVQDLLLPPEVATSERLTELVVAWDDAALAFHGAQAALDTAWAELRSYANSNAPADEDLEAVADIWANIYYADTGDEELWKVELLAQLTDSPRWREAKERITLKRLVSAGLGDYLKPGHPGTEDAS